MADIAAPALLSLKVAGIASAIVLIAGLLLTNLLHGKHFRGKFLLDVLLLLPLVLPPSVIGFLLLMFFGNNGPAGKWLTAYFDQQIVFTQLAAVIAAAVVALPLFYQTAKSGFSYINPSVEQAAQLDGAGWWRLFLHIRIPLAARSIAAAFILSFARALGEFGATLMFAGNIPGRTQTMPTAIYLAMNMGDMTTAWTYVLIMIAISIVMLALVTLMQRRAS